MADKTTENKNLFGAAIMVWSLVLLAAFLANRGDDAGRLGQLLGNLGGGPLIGSGVVASIVGVCSALLIAGAWFGSGHFILSFLAVSKNAGLPFSLKLALRLAVGAAVWSLIWFFLGLVGGYSAPAAIGSAAAGIVLGILGFRRRNGADDGKPRPERTMLFDKAMLALIAVPLLLSLIASLAPPTAKDTLLYHFSLPKAFISQGSAAFVEGNIASYLALGTEMHVVWAMLLGGSISSEAAGSAAGATVWIFFPLLLLAVYGWARDSRLSVWWSLFAVLAVASVPTVYYVAANAYVDVALAAYVTLAIYSLSRWWRSLERGWLIPVAIFLGAALSIKLTTVVVMAAFALVIIFRAREAKETEPDAIGRIFAGGFVALMLAGAIASPWYLRTWSATGSPVFPFYLSLWSGEAPGWDVERSDLFQAMNSQYGGTDKTVIDHLIAPWKVSVNAQLEDAKYFDGVLGVTFLAGLPMLIIALWKFDLEASIKIGVTVSAVMFLFWLFSSQQLRYLIPILPVLAISIAGAADRIADSALVRGALVLSCFVGLVVSAAWFLQKAPLRAALGGESGEQYLTRNIDYYPYYQSLNTGTPAGSRVWLINMRRDSYHLERPYVSDYLFEDWTLRKMVWESRSLQELRAKAAAMNVQYVLTRHDFLFDYDRSTIVDDKKQRAENEAKIRIAEEFLLDPARTVRSDQKFSLIKVF